MDPCSDDREHIYIAERTCTASKSATYRRMNDYDEPAASDAITRPVMFTVDVEGDWGGSDTRAVREVLPGLLKLLRRHSATATFFVVANLVDQVRDLLDPNGPDEVGSHGLTHSLLTRLAPGELAKEVEESKRLLEEAGYSVAGFRAPFFKSPGQLPEMLAGAGYCYDASCGSVYPSWRSRSGGPPVWDTKPALRRIETSVLRDGLTPFNLTYLRIYHPIGLRLVSPDARLFYCHPHELLEGTDGWRRLPSVLRRLHRRNSGAKAWEILDRLLTRFGSRFVSCKHYLDVHHARRPARAVGKTP